VAHTSFFLLAMYTYDAAGNVTNDGSHSYTYDAEGRVLQVDSGNTATYIYNENGQRVHKTTSSGWTEYYYGPNDQVQSEYNGGWPTQYVYAGSRLLALYTNSTTEFVHPDHLGSTRLLTGVSGNILDNMDYEPYGQQTAGGSATTHKFTGKERDAESGNDYFGARYYASSMGRFLSPDPSQLYFADPTNPQSLNLYAYALNNPLKNTDPSGLYCTYFKSDFGNYNDVENVDDSGQYDTSKYSSAYDECASNGGQWTEVSSIQVNANDDNNSPSTTSTGTNSQIPTVPTVVQGQLPTSQTVTCVGIGRGLAGVQAPFPKKGGAFNYGKNPVQVTAGTAAVIPSQFGFTGNVAMKPFVGEIAGDVGTNHFSSVTDSVDNAVSPVAGLSTPAAFQQLNPGRLIVEITAQPDVGKNALVNIAVPRSVGCPANTAEAR
jgi:RHS repeat-associated protein